MCDMMGNIPWLDVRRQDKWDKKVCGLKRACSIMSYVVTP